MNKNNGTSTGLYGISRIDSEKHNAHAWKVSLRRHGKRHVKNFTDKKHGGKDQALLVAMEYRDQFLVQHPPISRKEFCNAKRSHNRTGITGVCKFRKTYRLKDGTIKESWYWSANWPDANGKNINKPFSIKMFGEDLAKQKAIRAREEGMQSVEGTFWAAERGEVQTPIQAADSTFDDLSLLRLEA